MGNSTSLFPYRYDFTLKYTWIYHFPDKNEEARTLYHQSTLFFESYHRASLYDVGGGRTA